MGCDYYIQNELHVYFEDEDYSSLEVERECRGCYYDDNVFDESKEDYETKVNEYIKECLTPKMKPVVIYDNNFNKPLYEIKYKPIVENFMKDCGKKISDITKIIKVEVRYER